MIAALSHHTYRASFGYRPAITLAAFIQRARPISSQRSATQVRSRCFAHAPHAWPLAAIAFGQGLGFVTNTPWSRAAIHTHMYDGLDIIYR